MVWLTKNEHRENINMKYKITAMLHLVWCFDLTELNNLFLNQLNSIILHFPSFLPLFRNLQSLLNFKYYCVLTQDAWGAIQHWLWSLSLWSVLLKMELKVWVEGIQRIVCGVTETTTCQVRTPTLLVSF